MIIITFIMRKFHKMLKCAWQDKKRNKKAKELKLQLKVNLQWFWKAKFTTSFPGPLPWLGVSQGKGPGNEVAKFTITSKTYNNSKNYDKNARRKRWIFSLALKLLTVLALLMSNGNTFQRFGAAQVKERSPSVNLVPRTFTLACG